MTRHLLRGAAGLTLLIWALNAGASGVMSRAAAGLLAIAMLRGCPMCWTVGLVETIAHRVGWRA